MFVSRVPPASALGAQIGFHAAYIEKAGRASESGVGNALVGSYLTQIGLSENAVVYITQAAYRAALRPEGVRRRMAVGGHMRTLLPQALP
jgi:hypothetical protein